MSCLYVMRAEVLCNETNFSTEQSQTEERPRVPQTHEHEKRTQSIGGSSSQRQKSTFRLRPQTLWPFCFRIRKAEDIKIAALCGRLRLKFGGATFLTASDGHCQQASGGCKRSANEVQTFRNRDGLGEPLIHMKRTGKK